ncbi:hypothetical protein MKEN_00490500 [Mycena kentingensis (nom. inval.)]|nr:hypothetical protein MKEN_00490500 [Mycena kentingensis (nom. inval.)]
MSSLPPELLDAILSHVFDVKTLKTCSLVAPQLRDSSQRRLFQRLRLSPNSLAVALALLDNSPRIGAYFTTLHIQLSDKIEWDVLGVLLPKLCAVNECIVNGPRAAPMREFAALDAIGFWDYVQDHSARHLQIQGLGNLPVHIFYNLLGATKSISFDGVGFQGENEAQVPDASSSLISLHIGRGCLHVARFFAGQSALALHHLSVIQDLTLFISGYNHLDASTVLSRTASTLKTLQLHCMNVHSEPACLPALPVLQRMTLAFDNTSRVDGRHWLVSALTSLLDHPTTQSPRLEQLDIVFDGTPTLWDDIPGLESVDALLGEHPHHPNISWILPDSVGAMIRTRMPSTGASNRLVISTPTRNTLQTDRFPA